jgi:MFS family permease
MHADSVATGYIFAAGGLGSLLGALVSAPLQKLWGFKRLIIVSAWIWGLLWLVYLLAPNPPVLAALNCLGYAIVPIFMVTAYSYRIAITPDGLQGRVNSVFRLLSRGGVPLGIALTGVMLQYLGTTSTILITFVPQFIVALMATGSKVLHHSLTIDEA